VQEFLDRHAADHEVEADIALLRAEHVAETSPPPMASVSAYVRWLMDHDRKSTGLKSLQGKIWEEGYRAGELRGEVYPDVPPALARWREHGRDIAIFSSGSVQAQRDLFATTTAGDLTRFIRAYFDTTTGPKGVANSYTSIAAALGRSPDTVLFLSDVAAELDAARTAGMQTALCVRTTEMAVPSGEHQIIRMFDEVP
jgi:enolase-phosphatase E1